ncbi:MAG TPA: hypothetical protein VFI58_00380 [Xanthobacteraceae bacterium]|jgi:uncharacterized membrane protein|nr:hypothetical protein [Xanthobacteraceae bacterium]
MPVYTYTTIEGPLVTTDLIGGGINDNGQIVGTYFDATNHGFLLSGGTYTTLDDPLGVGSTSAQGINASGQIVGTYSGHGFLKSRAPRT